VARGTVGVENLLTGTEVSGESRSGDDESSSGGSRGLSNLSKKI